MINVTSDCYGKHPFRNGMHDAIGGINKKDNLYRKTYISNQSHSLRADINRLLWRLGHFFQCCTGLGHVNQLVSCGRCRHRHDPERMHTAKLTGRLLLCKECKDYMMEFGV